MALSDIFTVQFLISLGITLLLVGLLGMFFVQRLQEQNHKMASMLGLVSTMAEELNFIRGRLQMMSYVPQTGGVPFSKQQTPVVDNLIPVSDGDDEGDSDEDEGKEDDDEDEDDEDEDDEDDDDEDDDDEDDDEDKEDDDDDDENRNELSVLDINSSMNNIIELNQHDNSQTVKIINFGDLVAPSNSEISNEDLEDLDEVQELDDMDDLDVDEESENDVEIKEEDNNINLVAEHKLQEDLHENVTLDNLSFIKSINISNLEEQFESGSVDYKKMSMTKLKSIALAKGLIQENSKATKNAILKMLASE